MEDFKQRTDKIANSGASILKQADKGKWKPNTDQMHALFHCVMEYRNELEHRALVSLYNDLVAIGGKDVTIEE